MIINKRMMKKVLILGSTGSIGVNTLNVIRELKDTFTVTGLTTNTNIDLLERQIVEFKPEIAIVGDSNKAAILRQRLSPDIHCEILAGEEGLLQAAQESRYDIMVAALVGFVGLKPTIEGLKRNKRIAIANKETLVVAGEVINELVESHKSELIPVDSEHSAIFQALAGESKDSIAKIILTASGGPFRTASLETLKNATVSEALNHPNWEMGKKVTIDSATMMNKGLEIIEARWLFGVPPEKIDVVVHPQSIVHSLVEFVDGSIKAQLSSPDMKLPIQYALTYPVRLKNNFVKTNLAEIKNLTFYKPDFEKFETLTLAYNALKAGGTAPCILNAANEFAVEKFLNNKIKFLEITTIIKTALEKIPVEPINDIETIYECNRKTRALIEKIFNQGDF